MPGTGGWKDWRLEGVTATADPSEALRVAEAADAEDLAARLRQGGQKKLPGESDRPSRDGEPEGRARGRDRQRPIGTEGTMDPARRAGLKRGQAARTPGGKRRTTAGRGGKAVEIWIGVTIALGIAGAAATLLTRSVSQERGGLDDFERCWIWWWSAFFLGVLLVPTAVMLAGKIAAAGPAG